MLKTFKQLFFLFNVFFIFSSELFFYFIYKDFSYFIKRTTHRLASINILYVKLFQAIALNNSLIDDKINNKLLEFTDNAPWTFHDINLEELIEVTDKYNLILPYGFEKPLNSGMISLVFKAYKRGDAETPLIIKMKRRNIEEKLKNAIENLQFFMYILSFIPVIQKYQIVEVINKNIDIITHQTQFSQEVENMTKIKCNCSKLKYVVIPKVYTNVTQEYPNVILMEYIDGIKINRIQKEDYEEFGKLVMKFGFVTTIIHGFAHGDLHSGNILFIKDVNNPKNKYKIGVIDFGIMYEVDEEYKKSLFNILTEMFECTPRENALKILYSGVIIPSNVVHKIPNSEFEKIAQFTSEIIEDTLKNTKNATQLQIYKFMSKLKEYMCNPELSIIGIKPSDNFVKTQLVLAMAHGVTLTLCKDDFFTLADKVLNELFNINLLLSE